MRTDVSAHISTKRMDVSEQTYKHSSCMSASASSRHYLPYRDVSQVSYPLVRIALLSTQAINTNLIIVGIKFRLVNRVQKRENN